MGGILSEEFIIRMRVEGSDKFSLKESIFRDYGGREGGVLTEGFTLWITQSD